MKNRNKYIVGVILILIGLFWLGREFGWFYISFGSIFPFILIGIGIWLIIRRRQMEIKIETSKFEDLKEPPLQSSFTGTEAEDMSDYAKKQASDSSYTSYSQSSNDAKVSEAPTENINGHFKFSKFLGDMFINLAKDRFRQVEASIFIGDIEMLLQGSQPADGLNRIVISGFIGDIRIFVPKDLAIFANCSNFLGDIEACGKKSSSIGNNLECQSENYMTANTKVYIAVNCFIGDIKFYQV